MQIALGMAVLAEELEGMVADQDVPRPDPSCPHREQIGDAVLVMVEGVVGPDEERIE